MKPVVSVIIPVWQGEKTLRRCVESLVLGTERNIQVILVDDASTDESPAICRQLAEEYVQVQCIRNAENRGVSHSRNRGLAAAQAEHVLFVDSDDWVSSEYVETLLRMARSHPDALNLCGFCFIDRVYDQQRVYAGAAGMAVPEQFISLMEKTLLQTLWNKIFRRDVITRAGLCFDERQSMGEDFQFVLDYMEAAQITGCMVCSQPLYYYIRHSRQSLMSRFGMEQLENQRERLRRLYRLSGKTDPAILETMLRHMEENCVYHILRNPELTKAEMLQQLQKQGLEQYYASQRKLLGKERLAANLQHIRRLPHRGKQWLQRMLQKGKIHRVRRKLRNRKACLICQNCIGGVFYHDMGLPFLSPTINLFFSGEDFVRFAEDLSRYLALEPQMYWGERYPMGKLGDVTVHFMHYDTCREAKEAWLRRAKRVVPEQAILLCTDMEGFAPEVFARWQKLPYPKVLFTARKEFAQDADSVLFPEFSGKVEDLIPGRRFYRHGRMIQIINQLS